jgi:hypothetical protein
MNTMPHGFMLVFIILGAFKSPEVTAKPVSYIAREIIFQMQNKFWRNLDRNTVEAVRT